MSKSKKYSNGEVTIVWKPDACIHSGICVKGLPKVFNPKDRPWIKIYQATTATSITQGQRRPSRTAGHLIDNSKDQSAASFETSAAPTRTGPLLVYAASHITRESGHEWIKTNPTH